MFRWMIVFGQRPRRGKPNNNSGPPLPKVQPDMIKASVEDRHRKLTILSDRLHERRRESGKHAARSIG
ncbi:hypothetical protein LCGC14_0987230 [marine sediment metagenome]|uniref:Uncharacterized protein n=1 Tax=marine sediment metagenome TaxID=412755 RepID=A0A0F9NBI2_9ZZZZ